MAKVAAKAKKPVGPTPAQLAAAKLAAGSGGNVLEELMKIVDKEQQAEIAVQKAKAEKAYLTDTGVMFQYAASYCSKGEISYKSYALIKVELDKLKIYLQHFYNAEGSESLKSLASKLAKECKTTFFASDYYNKVGVPYLEFAAAKFNELVDLVAKPGGLDGKATTVNINAFEAKSIMGTVLNLYSEGKANKAVENAISANTQPNVEVVAKEMPKEKLNVFPDLADNPATQKRHGIVAISSLEEVHRRSLHNAVLTAEIICTLSPKRGGFAENKAWMEHKKVVPDEFLRLFFRPCPKVPRHGFVDSRVCVNWEEVEAIYNETIAADPESEVIVMYELEAQASAVATSNMIVVGPSNDGATAGKNSIVYDIKSAEIPIRIRSAAKLTNDQEGYVEAVFDGKWSYLVQLRGGPKVGSNAKRVCAKTVESVRQVVTAEGDGLEWESKMLSLGKSHEAASAVVWHPGGSMLSHYAVHALLNGLAISFEDDPPKIGDTFEGEKPNMEWDSESFARGVVMALLDSKAGRLSDEKDLREAFVFAATGVHSATKLIKGDSAELLGGACATLMLLSAAACCGESRHNTAVRSLSGISSDRHKVFVRALSDYMGARALLRLSLESFAADTWGSSYGGQKWAICAAMCIDLERVLFDIIKGEGSVAEAVQLSHRLLNAVHNGGKLLNKFGDPSILDYAAQGSRSFAVHSAFRWYAISHGVKSLPQTKISEMRARIISSGDFDKGAFEYWDTSSGTFVFTAKYADGPKYDMVDGQAQVRIVDVSSNRVKVQYHFRIQRQGAGLSVSKSNSDFSKYKNISKHDVSDDQVNESGYVSLTVYNKELVDVMSAYAEKVGGLEMATSMASSSSVLYVKATAVKPIGSNPKHGAIIYFGDTGVEVKP